MEIKDNIVMKVFKYLTILFFLISCNTVKVKEVPVNLITIDFMDFFNNDKISVKINETSIFENVKMKSNVVGNTQHRLYIKIYQNNSLITKFNNRIIKIPNLENKKVKIETMINNKSQTFDINSDNGKFIGFDKDGDSLYISQSKIPFEYM